tara:strand:+ start:392 stop:709 length:318 start_codon:yes stop_codon:yes gene_type:complete
MKHFKVLFLLITISLIYSCSSVKEGFINQKKNSSDEFFVEKKSPLVLPPDYDELPVPNSSDDVTDKEKNKIEKLVKNKDNTENSDNNTNENKTFEESLLEKIKKN